MKAIQTPGVLMAQSVRDTESRKVEHGESQSGVKQDSGSEYCHWLRSGCSVNDDRVRPYYEHRVAA